MIKTTPTGKEWSGYDLWDEVDIRNNRIHDLQERITMSENARPEQCPDCGNAGLVKFGRTNKGTQRYRCKACGCTCSSKGIMAGSQLPRETWMLFAECYADGLSVRRSAEKCKISLSTAYRMKCRLEELEGLEDCAPAVREVYRGFRDFNVECYRSGAMGHQTGAPPLKTLCARLSSCG